MPRPNLGPRLVLVRKPGWTRSVYYIRWTEGGKGREKSTGYSEPGPAQSEFEDWLEERRRTRRAGAGDPAAVLVRDVLNDYQSEHGDEVDSPGSLAYAVDPLLAFFADDTIATLTTGRVKAYWTWRAKHSIENIRDPDTREILETRVVERGAGAGTIIRELAGCLRPAIAHAIAQKRLQLGAYYVPVPPAPAGRDYWITRQQAARLVWEARCDPRARLHLPLYVLIALYTGQRRGAILDLTWQQVDLVRGTINFNAPGRRQTKKRRPIIPVPRSLLAALRRAQRYTNSPHVIAYQGERVGSVKKGFASAADRAGIPDCTSHTLRHTAGTWMAQKGVNMHEIAGYLGHSYARTTELYAHHHPDFLRGARAAFE